MRADMSRTRSAPASVRWLSACRAGSAHRRLGARIACPALSPQSLFRKERSTGASLLPSGEGAPQGWMRVRAKLASMDQRVRCALRTLTPTPLPVGEGLRASLLPPGEGAPQGRMRVGRSGAAMDQRVRCALRTLTPTPLPVGEGLRTSLLPSGESAPQGRMRVRAQRRSNGPTRAFRAPHPSPSPEEKGAIDFPPRGRCGLVHPLYPRRDAHA